VSDFRDFFRDDEGARAPTPSKRQLAQLHLWVRVEGMPDGRWWVQCTLEGLESEPQIAESKLAGIKACLENITSMVDQ